MKTENAGPAKPRNRRFILWFALGSLACCIYFWPNYRAYQRFQELCRTEAGLRVFARLEPDVAWTVPGGEVADARLPLSFKRVSFVRYHDRESGVDLDVRSAPRFNVSDRGFVSEPARAALPIRYRLTVTTVPELEGETRVGAQYFEVFDLKTGAVAVRYTRLGFSKFDPNRTILGAPSGEQCPDVEETHRQLRDKSDIVTAFEQAFL